MESVLSGLENCLSHLRKLEKFQIDGKNVTYNGAVINLESREQNDTKKAQSVLVALIKDNKTMMAELEKAKRAIGSNSAGRARALNGAVAEARTTDGNFNKTLFSTARSSTAASVSHTDVQMSQDGNTQQVLSELMKTRVQFSQQRLPHGQKDDHLGASSITQFPTMSISCKDPSVLKAQIEQLQLENEGLKQKQEQDTRQVLIQEFLDSMKKRSSALTEDETLRKLIGRNAELIDRLAAEMNARIAANESSLENIGIQNRPTRVADEYSNLMSNAWLAAKDALDERSPEHKYEQRKNLFLTGILEIAERKAAKHFRALEENIAVQLKDPLAINKPASKLEKDGVAKPKERVASKKDPDHDKHKPQLPSYVLSSVCDYLRQSADYTNLHVLVQEIHDAVLQKYGHDKHETEEVMNKPEFVSYIKQTAQLAWKMVLQKPPMRFSFDGVGAKWPGEKVLDLTMNSEPQRSGAKVIYYKYPSLFHGDKSIVKGVVFVQ